MKTRKKRSVIPVYSVAVVWVLYTIFHGLATPGNYAGVIALSVLVYLLMHVAFPDKIEQVEEKQAPVPPAEPEDPVLASLRKERDRAVTEMRRLNDNIQDETISRQIDHLEATTTKIFDAVIEKPEKKGQIRQFMEYFLPTTIKLLNAYDRADSVGISGSNVNATKDKVREMLSQIEGAFDRQLDNLFQGENLDIAADIQVMETLMAQEGLTDSPLSQKKTFPENL